MTFCGFFRSEVVSTKEELTPGRTRKLIPPTVVQGGGGVVETPPLGFCGVTIFGKSFCL